MSAYINKNILTPSEFNTNNLDFGYFDANGEFYKLKDNESLNQGKIENHYKIHIGYKTDNKIKHLLFTYDVSNIKWNKLPKGIINYNNFFDKSSKVPKLDLLTNSEEPYIDDFIDMLNSIKIMCKKFVEIHYPKKKQYKFIIKNVYNQKLENNICYINNIKFKKSFKPDNENTYKSKIYLKKRVNGELIDELITDYDSLLMKYFRVVPIIHLYGLYLKVDDNTVYVTQELFLEEILLYNDNTFIKSKPISNINTIMLNDNDYKN